MLCFKGDSLIYKWSCWIESPDIWSDFLQRSGDAEGHVLLEWPSALWPKNSRAGVFWRTVTLMKSTSRPGTFQEERCRSQGCSLIKVCSPWAEMMAANYDATERVLLQRDGPKETFCPEPSAWWTKGSLLSRLQRLERTSPLRTQDCHLAPYKNGSVILTWTLLIIIWNHGAGSEHLHVDDDVVDDDDDDVCLEEYVCRLLLLLFLILAALWSV